ncbi:glutamyl-tRNA reductase [Alginatibacterium sediminis]|uniref:Glutamyl-tRNA reductase n=1 Tax=Alginatibacterium sediminis TaxID=2164068 RepID=A0A420E661_9ALTE|nr:glutamyl-tRNA reductase [Alginatibacterium sediminis]RKF13639.1 glutamyl-tRNA reductase [Alginatibacterium sediminis]
MSLLALGLNHKTAPVAIRESVAFDPEQVQQALLEGARTLNSELVIVSTCNRTELYLSAVNLDKETVLQWLCQHKNIELDSLRPSLYIYEDQQAVEHLMRVSAGLDSLILGEPQILGQVKQSFAEAKEAGAVSSVLERWFQHSFTAAKRIRTETEIGVNAVSVAFAAVSLAKSIFADLSQSKVLLVGAGETIELVAKHLFDQGVTQMIVANRTVARAKPLADAFGAQMIALNAIPDHLASADIVISSTASPLPIIGKGMVETALKARRYRPMFFVDIAVPRDIEAQVDSLNDAYLYTVDDLQGIVEQNLESRAIAAKEAQSIVIEQAEEFCAWQRSLVSVATVKDYRSDSEQIRDEAVDKAIEALNNGKDPQDVVHELAFKLTNRLIHAPTLAINRAGRDGRIDELAVIRDVIGLRK